jgi:hypothetical protein
VDDGAKSVVVCRLFLSILCEGCETDFSDQGLGLGTQMPYEVQNRQIVESVKVEKILRIQY